MYILGFVLIFGVTPIIAEGVVTEYGASVLLYFRYFYGTLLLLLLNRSYIKPTEFKATLKNLPVVISALFYSFIALWLFYEALAYAPAGLVTLIWNLTPLLFILVGVLFFHDKMGRFEIIGSTIVIIASLALTLIRYDLTLETSWLGVILTVLSIVASTIGVVLYKKHVKERFVEEYNTLTIVLSFIGFLVIILFTNPTALIQYSFYVDWRILFVAIVTGVIGNHLFTKALNYFEVSELMMFTYLQSLVTVLLERYVINTPFTVGQSFFIFLILLGFIIELYGIARQRKYST